jgi:hypothetical protein
MTTKSYSFSVMNKKLFIACFGDEHYNTVPLVLQLVWLQAVTLVIHPDAAWIYAKLQEVNVYTAAENMKKMADGDLYITSTKEVRDTELFMARAQSIRNVLANTYDIPAGRIFIEKNPAVIASLDPQKSCVIVYINE